MIAFLLARFPRRRTGARVAIGRGSREAVQSDTCVSGRDGHQLIACHSCGQRSATSQLRSLDGVALFRGLGAHVVEQVERGGRWEIS